MSTTGAKLSGSANSRTSPLALLGQDGGRPGGRASPGRWAGCSGRSGCWRRPVARAGDRGLLAALPLRPRLATWPLGLLGLSVQVHRGERARAARWAAACRVYRVCGLLCGCHRSATWPLPWVQRACASEQGARGYRAQRAGLHRAVSFLAWIKNRPPRCPPPFRPTAAEPCQPNEDRGTLAGRNDGGGTAGCSMGSPCGLSRSG